MLIQTSFHSPPIRGTIWDSAEKFKERFAILYYVVCTVYNRLHHLHENSDDDDIRDDRLLKNLKGEFKIDYTGYCIQQDVYGFSGVHGITMNKNLVDASIIFYVYNKTDWMKKFDGLVLFTVLQQTIEHEVARITKHRHDRLFNNNGSNDDDPVLCFAQPGRVANDVNASTIRHYHKSSLLKVEGGYVLAPSRGRVFFSVFENSVDYEERPNNNKIVYVETVDELEKYFHSYPKFEFDFKDRKREVVSRKRSSSPHIGHTNTPRKRIISQNQITETSSVFSDRNDGFPPLPSCFSDDEGRKEDMEYILNSWALCNISATFCDENRNTKDQFTVGENVYVAIEFKNNSHEKQQACCISMDKKTFGRNGIRFCINGMVNGYIPSTDDDTAVVVVLEKGESYKFFRILCWGDKASAMREGVRYAAPDKPGTYSKTSLVCGGQEYPLSCTLRVVEQGLCT